MHVIETFFQSLSAGTTAAAVVNGDGGLYLLFLSFVLFLRRSQVTCGMCQRLISV